ncbi:MAG: formylglycine-generating enzyme family protein, partial [Xanthomonadales bacterium]|nr:formylglycine-generating enzyme family protein [Xanthomonadales bacterium]
QQESNLLPPVELEEAEAQELEGGQDSSAPARRIRRLGDVQAEEWRPQFETAPSSQGPNVTGTLPDQEQNTRLYELLDDLAATPGNQSVRRELDALLQDVMQQAELKTQQNQLDQAREMLDVVKSVRPEMPGLDQAYQDIEERGNVSGQLVLAREAMEAGRVVSPSSNNAWYFYRKVADQDPNNAEAQRGLTQVQQYLIDRAMEFARELDFDSTDRMLEEARLVLEDPTLVDLAEREISSIRSEHAENLEAQAVSAMDNGDFERAERILVDIVALGNSEVLLGQLRRRLEEARMYGGFKPGQRIRDHFLRSGQWTPELLVITAGSFMMGSDTFDEGHVENESPEHRVTIRRGFALGIREISVGEFREFVDQTGYSTEAERRGYSTVYNHASGRLAQRRDVSWEQSYDGRDADEKDPVLHVSWNDATAYVQWLARGTGKPYRLPSEAEFEYALRGGTTTSYWWGNGSPTRVVENLTGDGDESRSRRSWTVAFENYKDGYWGPAPVGSFQPNPFGLYDISGNVAEWVRDCWHDTYIRAPADGSAWVNPGCGYRVVRGGYWASSPQQTRSAFRLSAKPDTSGARVGFRVARDL